MNRYNSGANFERRVKKYYEKQGWVVIRAAGSHGPADLVAMINGKVLFVQCKVNGRISPYEANKLINVAERAGALPYVAWRGSNREIHLQDVRILP